MCRFRDEPPRFREVAGTLMRIVEVYCARSYVNRVNVWTRDGVVQVEVLQMAMVEKIVNISRVQEVLKSVEVPQVQPSLDEQSV